MPTDSRYILISVFGFERGHSVDDTRFYFEALSYHKKDFSYYLPEFSANLLGYLSDERCKPLKIEGLNSWRHAFKIVKQINIQEHADVVFTGYTEKIILAFILTNFFRKYNLTLSVTNNLKRERFDSSYFLMKIFFRLISFRLKKIIVHTNAEVDALRKIYPRLKFQILKKTHHKFVRRVAPANDFDLQQRSTIIFLGPIKREKPIKPVFDLVMADTQCKYDYRIFNTGTTYCDAVEQLAERANVALINRFLTEDELEQELQAARYVFLSHNSLFDGVLSGNLMDALACGTPFIAEYSDVHIELRREYAELGYLADFKHAAWAKEFIASDESGLLEMQYRSNIQAFNQVVTHSFVRDQFSSCL